MAEDRYIVTARMDFGVDYVVARGCTRNAAHDSIRRATAEGVWSPEREIFYPARRVEYFTVTREKE